MKVLISLRSSMLQAPHQITEKALIGRKHSDLRRESVSIAADDRLGEYVTLYDVVQVICRVLVPAEGLIRRVGDSRSINDARSP
jgi:hypothetical protein